jgi:hypothetical protein
VGFDDEAEALMIGPWLMPRQQDNSVPAVPDNPLHGHHPFARPLKGNWTKDATGRWHSGSVDAHSWEVICEECGDTDGPIESQALTVRARRGPYSSHRKAEHAATKHFNGDK